ncbi:MAG: protein kinase [Planctomycetota bacterium]
MFPRTPERIGPYPVRGVLGRGGMGAVYLGYHPGLGCELAIKVLLGEALPARRQRFERELEALRRLRDHPGIVCVLDAGLEGGQPWLAMRRVEGPSLAARLRERGPLPVFEVIGLGLQLCAALEAAHAEGILHRDLKPDNVLCAPGGGYVVTDFGLAKDLEVQASIELSRSGTPQGTPGYWAPEQADGRGKEATEATDVYGLGATLYTALTGRAPFEDEEWIRILNMTRGEPPPPPSRFRSDIPASLEAIVLRCLEKDPTRRFASVAELADALERPESVAPAGARRFRPALAAVALLVVGGLLGAAALRARPSAEPEELAATASPSDAAPVTPTGRPAPNPQPAATAASSDARPEALLARWPADALLRPRAVLGDETGQVGAQLQDLGWEAADRLLGVAQGQLVRWDARSGAETRRTAWEPGASLRGVTALDARAGRLWAAQSRGLQLWELESGASAKLSLPRGASYARIALAADGRSAVVAGKAGVARWTLGARELEPRSRVSHPFPPHVALLPDGRLAIASNSLSILEPGGEERTVELPAPVAEVGGIAAREDVVFLLDVEGQLQRWDLRTGEPAQLAFRVPAAPPAPPRRARGVQRALLAGPTALWVASADGGGSPTTLRRFDLTGRLLGEREVPGLSQLVPGPDGLLALSVRAGAGERVSVWRDGAPVWKQQGPAADGALAVEPRTGAVYTGGAEVNRWDGEGARRLPGARGPVDALLPTPEGTGYFAVAASGDLELWGDEGLAPLQRWDRRKESPLGPGELRLLAALGQGRAVGWSRVTRGERRGSTITIKGQVEVLTVFGPGSESRELEWKGAEPLAARLLDGDRLHLIAQDRHGVLSLSTGAWEREQAFATRTTATAYAPGGGTFARWGGNGQIELWRLDSAQPERHLDLPLDLARGAADLVLGPELVVLRAGASLVVLRTGEGAGAPQVIPCGDAAPTRLALGSSGVVWMTTQRGSLIALAPRPR